MRATIPYALELPCGEAADVDVELVESRVVTIAGKLNLELQVILRDGLAAYRAGRTDSRPAPRLTRWARRATALDSARDSGWLSLVPRRSARRSSRNNLHYPGCRRPTHRAPFVFPMQLRVGDQLKDEKGEYEVIGRPYTTAGGKMANVRVRRVDNAEVTMIRVWSAHERIRVKVTTGEEDK